MSGDAQSSSQGAGSSPRGAAAGPLAQCVRAASCAHREGEHGFLLQVTEVEVAWKSSHHSFCVLIVNIKQCLHGPCLISVPGRGLNYIYNIVFMLSFNTSPPYPSKPSESVNLLIRAISWVHIILLEGPSETQFLTRAASWHGREALGKQIELQLFFSSERLQTSEAFLRVISSFVFSMTGRCILWEVRLQ